MNEAVDDWNIAILGDRWDTDNMPRFQFDRGGTIVSPGKIGMVQVVVKGGMCLTDVSADQKTRVAGPIAERVHAECHESSKGDKRDDDAFYLFLQKQK
jgi:hypothetical protein